MLGSPAAGKVLLLTNPVVGGYTQNPISVYYCFAAASNKLAKCIAEVRRDSGAAQNKPHVAGACVCDTPYRDMAPATPADWLPCMLEPCQRTGSCSWHSSQVQSRAEAVGGKGASFSGSEPLPAVDNAHTHTHQPSACTRLPGPQVTNTPWGERVSFVFNPAGDVSPKALHVSPFMDMDNTW